MLASIQSSNTEAQALLSNVQYDCAWMLSTVKECQELDHVQISPCAELQAYPKSPLELTDMLLDGGRYVLAFNLLINNLYRNIKNNI